MNITSYDKWKFRRCIETLNRYSCTGSFDSAYKSKCKKCSFYLPDREWLHLHTEMKNKGIVIK